jgi:hypothetical protein
MGAAASVPQEQMKQEPMFASRGGGTIGSMMGNKTGMNVREQPAMLQDTKMAIKQQPQEGFGGIMRGNFQNQGQGQWWMGQRGAPSVGFGGAQSQVIGSGTLGGVAGAPKQIAPPDTSSSTGLPIQTFSDVKPIGSTATGKIGEVVGTVSGVATQTQPIKAEPIQTKNQYQFQPKAQPQFKGW